MLPSIFIIKNQYIILFRLILTLLLVEFAFATDINTEGCSPNPISECFLNEKLKVINAAIKNLENNKINANINPIFIYASITSALHPAAITGPTNYSGDGVVSLTITNNSLFAIELSCQGYIYMRGYSGTSIINSQNLLVTKKHIEINSITPIPSDRTKGYAIQTSTGMISSINTSFDNTLWTAQLGTEADSPLNCTISFLSNTGGILDSSNVYIPVNYN